MGTLYCIRHAQASFGSDNYDKLSDLGHGQSRHTGDWFARLGIRPDRRHRALDDAQVLWELVRCAATDIEPDQLERVVSALIKPTSRPNANYNSSIGTGISIQS